MSEIWTPGGMHKPDPTQMSGDLNSLIELYDSDLLVIEKVLERLKTMQGTTMVLEHFVIEARERFGEAGFIVECNMLEVQSPGVLPMGTMVPDITIKGRVERQDEFDREQMAWEVQQDVLGIDDNPGTITADGGVKSISKTTSFAGSSKPKE